MISDIRLQRFRSYRDESFEFDPGVNIIVGPNASGKTNLLEALFVSSTGRSFRAKDVELIAHGASWARIDLHYDNSPRVVKLLPQDNGLIKKEFSVQEQKLSRLRMLKGIPVVFFEPNHLSLLHGSPEARREYLDNLLSQTVVGYETTRREYKRALAQRNALLKRGVSSKDHLFAWDVRLSEIGARIAGLRHTLTNELDSQASRLYKAMAHTEATHVSLRYVPSCDITQYSSSMLHALEKRHSIDIERGFTTVGPHREDFQVVFNDRNAHEVASRGETRTMLLVLKVMELSRVEEARQHKPILLLDDVFSELDGARRKALTEVISGYQTFITTTDADVVVQHFMDNCHIIPMG